MSADPSLVSVTAKVAAYYRQFSDIPFAREAADRIGADAAFDRILREHGLERDKLTFYAPMFEARYKSLTQLLSGATQVLELASAVQVRSQIDATPSFSSLGRLGLSPALLEPWRTTLRVWWMTAA